MRTRWFSPVLVVLAAMTLSAPATAQTIAYTNFLQFDLQSYTSQATGGMFDDDIENIADAAKLMNIEGNRLFTSFSNLADPAGFGDNIFSYSVDHVGVPSGTDHFDTGSYLVGWVGKYDKDSEYNFSVFYQRNSARGMFEDLDGGVQVTCFPRTFEEVRELLVDDTVIVCRASAGPKLTALASSRLASWV